MDSEHLALYGLSFGGYLAPRAAAYDHRIKAVIANGGVYDTIMGLPEEFNMTREEFLDYLKTNPESFNHEIREQMKSSTLTRWSFENGMYTFNASSPSEFLLFILRVQHD